MSEQPAAGTNRIVKWRRAPLLVVGAAVASIVVLGVLAVTGVIGGNDDDTRKQNDDVCVIFPPDRTAEQRQLADELNC